jgi:hypothetical protein
MERRDFLRAMLGGVAVAAAVRTFPFRVYSFPSQVQIIRPDEAQEIISGLFREFQVVGWKGAADRLYKVHPDVPLPLDVKTFPSKRIILTDSQFSN